MGVSEIQKHNFKINLGELIFLGEAVAKRGYRLRVMDKHFFKKTECAMKKIMQYHLVEVIEQYDEKVFLSLEKKEYLKTKEYLSELCHLIIDMPEQDQVFMLRSYFISIITELVRYYVKKSRLHTKTLVYASSIIKTIEKWEYSSDFFLSISWFIDMLAKNIIVDIDIVGRSPYIQKALTLIRDNLGRRHLTAAWIAQQLGISNSYLSRIFKLEMNETVSRYILKRKIEEITFEMKYTNKSLDDIRRKYGFDNKSHFIQSFKKIKGKTPLKYKLRTHR